MKHYCKICDSSYVETTQSIVYYVCTMCRDYTKKHEQDRELKDNSIIEELVTDYGNN